MIQDDLGDQIPKIEDGPWPAFPADLTSIALAVATQAKGTILIFEKMFENRLFFVDKLVGMGARIILCDPHRAVVTGPAKLYGERMDSPDIRAGMAMLIAASARRARRRSATSAQIDRGYERIDERLRASAPQHRARRGLTSLRVSAALAIALRAMTAIEREGEAQSGVRVTVAGAGDATSEPGCPCSTTCSSCSPSTAASTSSSRSPPGDAEAEASSGPRARPCARGAAPRQGPPARHRGDSGRRGARARGARGVRPAAARLQRRPLRRARAAGSARTSSPASSKRWRRAPS